MMNSEPEAQLQMGTHAKYVANPPEILITVIELKYIADHYAVVAILV